MHEGATILSNDLWPIDRTAGQTERRLNQDGRAHRSESGGLVLLRRRWSASFPDTHRHWRTGFKACRERERFFLNPHVVRAFRKVVESETAIIRRGRVLAARLKTDHNAFQRFEP